MALFRLVDLRQTHVSRAVDKYGLSREEFGHLICCDVKHGLYDWSLGGEHHDFLVHIPEGGAYAPGVSYGEALSAACDATHDVASVPVFARLLQDMAHIDIVFYGMGDFQSDRSEEHTSELQSPDH